MAPHEQRVIDEKHALDGKIESLRIFLLGSVFKGLPLVERELLMSQYEVMTRYAEILAARIERFERT